MKPSGRAGTTLRKELGAGTYTRLRPETKKRDFLSYVKIPATSGTTATLSIFVPFVAGNKTVERKLINEKGGERILSRDDGDDSDDKEDSSTNPI